MKNLFSLKLANQLLGAIILSSSAQGFAQTEEDEIDPYADWYQVEFIIFKNLDENARQQEQWPTQKKLTLSEDTQSLNELLNIPLPAALQAAKEAEELTLVQLQQELANQPLSVVQNVLAEEDAIDATLIPIEPEIIVEESISENSTEELPDEEKLLLTEEELEPLVTFIPAAVEQLVLDHQAKQLKYNRKYKVIYHGAWQQQLSDGQPMASYRLSVETDGNELDGTINIIRKRFLHVATDLWMHEIAINSTAINTPAIQEDIQSLREADTLVVETDIANAEAIEAIEYARLYKKERMKSNELHYIDHPLMGMLVQITPFSELTPVSSSADDTDGVEAIKEAE